ncbi:5865_t:CDS:2 [Racocetra persica]|uniref:5865_t:CDS:1 n=1 Tax=Racocetra persica TaxID=160502 RepID=A0ACA9MXJ7_9GLOM|nr:5865_t:CDS:2 [Racocetra persica]
MLFLQTNGCLPEFFDVRLAALPQIARLFSRSSFDGPIRDMWEVEDNVSDTTSNEDNANLSEDHIYRNNISSSILSRNNFRAVTLSGNNTSTTLIRFSATNLRVSNI